MLQKLGIQVEVNQLDSTSKDMSKQIRTSSLKKKPFGLGFPSPSLSAIHSHKSSDRSHQHGRNVRFSETMQPAAGGLKINVQAFETPKKNIKPKQMLTNKLSGK